MTSPAGLNTNFTTDSGNDSSPVLATDGLGNWVAVWDSADDLGATIGTDRDILVSLSVDNGATWTAPAALNTNAATDAGSDTSPALSTDNAGNWIVVWQSTDDLSGTIGTDADVLVARSTDNGTTWSAPSALNSNAATDTGDDTDAALVADGAGNWIVAWQSGDTLGSTLGNDDDILVSVSADNGASWSAVQALNTNATTDNGKDRSPALATNGAGVWLALWDSTDKLGNTIGPDADILLSISTDNGATWTAPQALNSTATDDNGKDYSPKIATDGAGNWIAVWYSTDKVGGTLGPDEDILFARSQDNGNTWTAVQALNNNATTDSGKDKWPTIAYSAQGDWIVAWNSTDEFSSSLGVDEDIVVARSTDGGATWNAPQVINTNAASDAGSDLVPTIATDGAGNWVVVWQSDDTLNGTTGSDEDILAARFSFNTGVTITASAGSTDVSEDGPTSDTYTVMLVTNPTADVTITVTPDAQTDLGAGAESAIILTFTSSNATTPQTVTVTAVDDNFVEGLHTSTITHTSVSADGNYNAIVITDVTANITDDDVAGVTLVQTNGSLDLNEYGPSSDTYTVVLDTVPAADVTVTITPDIQTDVGAGAGIAIILTFTTANGSTPQTVTVTAIDDIYIEGTHTSTITHTAASTDGNYNGITIAAATATILDYQWAPPPAVVATPIQDTPADTIPPLETVAGDVQTVVGGDLVTLSAGDSLDFDASSNLTFLWVQTGGPSIMDEPIEAETIEFDASLYDETTKLTFELTVTNDDDPLLTTRHEIVVFIVGNAPPVAVVGPDQDAKPGDFVILSAEDSFDPDEDYPLTYSWRQVEGPPLWDDDQIPELIGKQVEIEVPMAYAAGKLVFELTITDSGEPPRSSTATHRINLGRAVASATAIGDKPAAASMCGAGASLALVLLPLGLAISTPRGRRVLRSATRMLVRWVGEARGRRSFDPSKLGKRQTPRWSWEKPIWVKLKSRAESTPVLTHDISVSGVMVMLPERVEVGTLLRVGEGNGIDEEIRGRVMHIAEEPDANGLYRAGIQFEAEDPEAFSDSPYPPQC